MYLRITMYIEQLYFQTNYSTLCVISQTFARYGVYMSETYMLFVMICYCVSTL